MEITLMIRKPVIKSVQTLWEKMHVFYHLCLDHARVTIQDMHITLKPSHARASTTEGVMAITIDLSQMMNVRLFVPKMTPTLPYTWLINAVFQSNRVLA